MEGQLLFKLNNDKNCVNNIIFHSFPVKIFKKVSIQMTLTLQNCWEFFNGIIKHMNMKNEFFVNL